MEQYNPLEMLKDNIIRLRREHTLTQDQLAEQLGVTFQAVSKWENGNSCPDIALLPGLADVFGISLDALFGRESAQKVPAQDTPTHDLPWPNDHTLRAAAFIGRRLVAETDNRAKEFTFVYKGDALHIDSRLNVRCGDVEGSVQAGCDVNCGDIDGNAIAGCDMDCGDIDGDASAGCNLNAGNIDGDASAGAQIKCGDIDGDASAGTQINCGDVGGDVSAGTNVQCSDIEGDVTAGGSISCTGHNWDR